MNIINKINKINKINNFYTSKRKDRAYLTMAILLFIGLMIVKYYLIPIFNGFLYYMCIGLYYAILFRIFVLFYMIGAEHKKQDYELK